MALTQEEKNQQIRAGGGTVPLSSDAYYGTNPKTGKPNTKAEAEALSQNGAAVEGVFFEGISFDSIEALPPIDVNGIVADIARINRGEFQVNLGIAFDDARQLTAETFTDFNAFVDTLLPGAQNLINSSAREVQNFITKGLPSAAQNNAILRDAGAMAAGGISGDIALRRSLYNEAQRDVAAVQYGIGQAQQMVNAAQNVGMQFANMQANATNAFLGQMNSATMITPGQAVGFAFDERNYQTGVMEFNATGNFNESSGNAQMEYNYASLGFQQEQQRLAMEAQRKAEKASNSAGIGSLIGGIAGGVIGFVGSGFNPYGAVAGYSVGSAVGGAVGNEAGGGSGGVTAGYVAQGVGSYAGYQAGMQNTAQQRASLEQTRRYQEASLEMQRQQAAAIQSSYGGSTGYGTGFGSNITGQTYYPGISSAPWRPSSQYPQTTFGSYDQQTSGTSRNAYGF